MFQASGRHGNCHRRVSDTNCFLGRLGFFDTPAGGVPVERAVQRDVLEIERASFRVAEYELLESSRLLAVESIFAQLLEQLHQLVVLDMRDAHGVA